MKINIKEYIYNIITMNTKTKSDKYIKERLEILKKIFSLLDFNENNNTFYLSDLDKNESLQKGILELETEIKKYFASSTWSGFSNINVKRKVLSIIRNLIKDMNYSIIPKRIFRKKEDISYRDTIYYIIKENKI